MTHWDLITVLLQLNLLEFNELGALGLDIEATARFVDLAIVADAGVQWLEAQRLNRLVGFSTALVASVSRAHHHRFYFRAAGHDSSDCCQLSDTRCFHVPD